jgi:hypothetical protein
LRTRSRRSRSWRRRASGSASPRAARAAASTEFFCSNYLALVRGLDLAYLVAGFSFQVEATIVGRIRARCSDADSDVTRSAATAGLHIG